MPGMNGRAMPPILPGRRATVTRISGRLAEQAR
jgi:hypothetical protein